MMGLRLLLLLLIAPILLLACALISMWLPLPRPFPPALSSGRNLMAAIVTGVLGVGYLVGLTAYAILAFLRAGRVLEPVLVSEGMGSESYLMFGRRYQGELEGREVKVNYLPAQGIQPAQLNVYVEADIGTSAAIGWQRPLLDCRDCVQLEVAPAELWGLHVYAEEAKGVERLLEEAASREAVMRLLKDQKELGFRELYLQPGKVWLRARPHNIEVGLFQQWLENVLVLAESAEKVLG
jgi:hypothetical protein